MQSTQVDRRQLLSRVKRIVVKVGSSTISKNFAIDYKYLNSLVDDLAAVKKTGKEVILVTSGAIATGIGHLKLLRRPATIPGLQAAAAAGQSRLMHAYETRFQHHGLVVAMMLLTQADFSDLKRYTYISDTLRTLLKLGAIPIINENDTVAVEEIKVGDNDTLAALITNLSEAELLIILSDQDGFRTADPRRFEDTERIPVVHQITVDLKRIAGSAGHIGTGGMITKLRAAEMVNNSEGIMILAKGRSDQLADARGKQDDSVVDRILKGEEIGTLFLPKRQISQRKLSQRKRWIAYSRPPKGRLFVDNGARDALINHGGSLLPSGVSHVEGNFEYGDTVSCIDESGNQFALGLANYSTSETKKIAGKHTSEIERVLGYHYYDEVIHRDNLVVMR